MERVQRAARLVEERFAEQKLRARGGQSKESLLIFLALGFADDLLQSEKKQDAVQERIASLLTQIEEFECVVPWSVRDLCLGANLTSI